jgi:hypothetical protein
MSDVRTPGFVGDLIPTSGRGEVAGVTRHAIHVRWDDGSWIGLVDRRGDRFPWCLQLQGLPSGIERGCGASADASHLHLGGAAYRTTERSGLPQVVGRWQSWPRIAARYESLVAPYRSLLSSIDRRVLRHYERGLSTIAGDRVSFENATDAFVGAGSGLTPFADDLIVGSSAAFATSGGRASERATEPDLRLGLEARTSPLSAWFLAMAYHDHFGESLLAVAAAALAADGHALAGALPRLTDLGSSSGTGMALGLQLGFTALAEKEPLPC